MFQLNEMIFFFFFFFSFQYHTRQLTFCICGCIIKPLESNYPFEALISYSRSSTVMKSITGTTHVESGNARSRDKRTINFYTNTRITVITIIFQNFTIYIEIARTNGVHKSRLTNGQHHTCIHLRIYAPQSRLIIN